MNIFLAVFVNFMLVFSVAALVSIAGFVAFVLLTLVGIDGWQAFFYFLQVSFGVWPIAILYALFSGVSFSLWGWNFSFFLGAYFLSLAIFYLLAGSINRDLVMTTVFGALFVGLHYRIAKAAFSSKTLLSASAVEGSNAKTNH